MMMSTLFQFDSTSTNTVRNLLGIDIHYLLDVVRAH